MDGNKFFHAADGFIYLDIPHCEFYIPSEYFDEGSKYAEIRGDIIHALGLFCIGLFLPGKNKPQIETLNLPTWTDFFVYESEKRDVDLPWYDGKLSCKVLHYYQGNKVMPDHVIQDSDNIQSYLKLITMGKLPHSIPVDKSPGLWSKNQSMNGADLGIPGVSEELILSASYRDKNDLTHRFAQIAGTDADVSMYDYEMVSIRRACQYTSTFSAITYEDFDSMAISSINRAKEKKKEIDSPLEEIIKM